MSAESPNLVRPLVRHEHRAGLVCDLCKGAIAVFVLLTLAPIEEFIKSLSKEETKKPRQRRRGS